MKQNVHITEAELTVMHCLWDADAPLNMNEILARVQQENPWEASTIKTLVGRLYSKGVLHREKRGSFVFSPGISREAYSEQATRAFVKQIYRGDAKHLVAALVDTALTPEDIEELRAILEGDDCV